MRLELETELLGGAWMRSDPSDNLKTTISAKDYRIPQKWWLGIPLMMMDTTCPACNQLADKKGDHLVCCTKNNFNGRHFAIQEGLISVLSQANVAHKRDVSLTKTTKRGGDLRQADILLIGWDCGADVALDCTVVHTVQPSLPRLREGVARQVLVAAEMRRSSYMTNHVGGKDGLLSQWKYLHGDQLDQK